MTLRPAMTTLSAALLAAAALSGCASPTTPPAEVVPERESPSDSLITPDFESWGAMSESGTGSGEVTIESPGDDATSFLATYSCASGTHHLEMVEDPRVFMGGDCAAGKTYQMPLPAGSDTYTFTIEVDPGVEWTFEGRFLPRQD